MPRRAQAAQHLAVFAACLLSTGVLSFGYGPHVGQSLIWVPSGVAVAGLWLLGLRAFWLVALCTLSLRLALGYAITTTAADTIGSTMEAVLAVWILRRVGLRSDLARLRDVLRLLASAALAPLASIVCSWTGRALAGGDVWSLAWGWSGWWRMNMLGVLTIVPPALVWLGPAQSDQRRTGLWPSLLVGGLTLLLVTGIMHLIDPGVPSIMLLTMVLPVSLWSASRLGPMGATITATTGALAIVAIAASGVGSFSRLPPGESHVAIQIFLVALVSVPLVFGALSAERRTSASRWRESEGNRRALLAALPDTAVTMSADGTFLDVLVPANQTPSALSAALVGRRIQDVVPPALAAQHLERIARAHRGEPTSPLEYSVDSPSGHGECEVRYVRLPNGDVLGVVRDITARKLAERQLAWQAHALEMVAARRSERDVFRVLVDELEALLPASMCSILLLRGNRLQPCYAPSVPAAMAELCEGLAIGPSSGACGTAAWANRTIVCTDIRTDPLWQEVREIAPELGVRAAWSVPVRAPDGSVLGTFAIYHPTVRTPGAGEIAMVERAAMLAGLAIYWERREGLLAAIQRNISEGLFRSVPEVGIVYANEALARAFGYPSPEAMRQSLAAHDHGTPAHRKSLERLANAEGTMRHVEMTLHRRDGSPFSAMVSTTLVVDASGARVACDGTVADITAKKELEEHLRQSQKMEAVGQLAGGVAHDFNNLLTAIAGFAESVHGELPPDSPWRKDLGEILSATNRAAGLTRQLLAFGRRQVMSPRLVDLVAVVDETNGMLRRLIGEHILLKIVHTSNRLTTRVDRGQMEQVLLNLVLNARDALPSGGTITVGTDAVDVDAKAAAANPGLQAGPHALLWVTDNGIGMSAEVRSRAFDPFFTTKPPGKGTGLGLSMVYGIVRQSGGAIRIDSTPERGTTVSLWLPRIDHPTADEPTVVMPRPTKGSGTVLVVEDEDLVRGLAQRALARAGYTVFAAADGQAALEIVASRGGAFDAVVSDVVMPRMSGRELWSRLHQGWPNIPVLLMTGYASGGDHPLQDGDVYLEKPFTAASLVEAVAQLIADHKQPASPPTVPGPARP